MSQPARVDLVRRTESADTTTIADRRQLVHQLAGLGHIDPTAGEVNTGTGTAWLARVGGAEFPVADFGLSPADGGRVLVNLVVDADAVSIGDLPSAGSTPPPGRPAAPEPKNERRQVWGEPGKPDPRENIPGWTAEATA